MCIFVYVYVCRCVCVLLIKFFMTSLIGKSIFPTCDIWGTLSSLQCTNFDHLQGFIVFPRSDWKIMENTTNFTTTKIKGYLEEGAVYTMYVITRFIVSVIIIVMNSIFISLYCWGKRKLLNMPSDRLLLSLAICDFLTGVGVILSAICNVYHPPKYRDENTDFIFRIIEDIYTVFLATTVVMHLCGITLDRYISLFYALKYKALVTNKSITCYIIVSWSLSLTASIIPLLWLHRVIAGHRTADDMKTVSNFEIWYSMISFALFLTIPMILLAVAFLAMFCEIRRLLRTTPGQYGIKYSSRQRRVIYAFCLMYFTFVIFAMPYFSLRFWIDVCYWLGYDKQPNINIVRLTIITKNITSIVNPLFYKTVSPELRSMMRELQMKLRKNASAVANISVDNIRKLFSSKENIMVDETMEPIYTMEQISTMV